MQLTKIGRKPTYFFFSCGCHSSGHCIGGGELGDVMDPELARCSTYSI